jgi:hypothetical protein
VANLRESSSLGLWVMSCGGIDCGVNPLAYLLDVNRSAWMDCSREALSRGSFGTTYPGDIFQDRPVSGPISSSLQIILLNSTSVSLTLAPLGII